MDLFPRKEMIGRVGKLPLPWRFAPEHQLRMLLRETDLPGLPSTARRQSFFCETARWARFT